MYAAENCLKDCHKKHCFNEQNYEQLHRNTFCHSGKIQYGNNRNVINNFKDEKDIKRKLKAPYYSQIRKIQVIKFISKLQTCLRYIFRICSVNNNTIMKLQTKFLVHLIIKISH